MRHKKEGIIYLILGVIGPLGVWALLPPVVPPPRRDLMFELALLVGALTVCDWALLGWWLWHRGKCCPVYCNHT